MILTAHQPAYLPWLGYLEKIMRSDVYIFMDCVQFEKNSFTNRNKIVTPQGSIWLTVPVLSKGHTNSNMLNLCIDNKKTWQRKHSNAIMLNYKKAPRYDELMEKIRKFYTLKYDNFIDFIYEYTIFWFEELNIKTKIVRMSNLDINSKKSDLVLDLCKAFNADTYISGALGRDYLEKEEFQKEGIKVLYQNYVPFSYKQLHQDEFIPYMSILDYAMNCDDYERIMQGGKY